MNIYIVIGSYVTASCNRSLLRIDAYLISCIQSNSFCRSNIAIGRNRNITGMLIIILRGINSGINGNFAGICLVVFNQDIALDMRISNSNQQIIRRTIKPGYAINHQAAACVLTLNRQALHLIALAEQLLRLAGFNCQIVCSDSLSRCILHYTAISIQLQAIVSTIHRNVAAAKCDITISSGNYAISASYQRAAVQVNVVACSDVACANRGNAAGCYFHIITCVNIAYTTCSNSTCVQVNVVACSNVACAACFNSTCVQVNVVTVNSYIATCVDDSVTCAVTEVYVAVQVELSISFSSNAVNYQARISLACALQVNRTIVCLSVNYSAIFQNTDTVISFDDIAVGCLQVNAVGVQITGILACFRSHLHTVICLEHQRTCCRILNCQHLRRLVAYSRLMQIYAVASVGICFQIAADISRDEGILAAYIALATLDNKVIGNNAAIAHANALITEQLNILRRINRTGNIQHSILNACQINITGIGSITGVSLQIQLAAICQLYRNLTLLTNFNSVVSIIPGKVTGFSLCQKLKVIQLAHLAVGNVGCFAVDTDVLACAQADVLALNVGLIYCKYLAGGCIQHAVLNSIQQLIFAPAVGSAVINLCVVDNPLQLSIAIAFASKYTVILQSLHISIASISKCLFLCLFICKLRCFRTSFNVSILRLVESFAAGKLIIILFSCYFIIVNLSCIQTLCLFFQCLHTLALGCRCRCRAFFCAVIAVNQSQLLPLLQLAFAVGQGAVAYCVDKAAAGCEVHITSLAGNMTDTHIAVVVGQRNIAIRVGIHACRHGITAGQRLTGSNCCVNRTKSGEINAVAVQNSAISRSNVACCVDYQVAAQCALIAADKLQLAAVGINAYVTSRCFNIQLRHVAQCTVIDADTFGCFGSQVVRVNARIANRADSTTDAV